MKLSIRVDGDSSTGMGHIVRMSLLADHLIRKGVHVSFITLEDTPGKKYLLKKKFHVVSFSSKADAWEALKDSKYVFLDIRGTSPNPMRQLRRSGSFIMDMEDAGAGRTTAHLLIDANRPARSDPRSFSPRCFFGPDYVILDPALLPLRKKSFTPGSKSILVCFGGSDPNDFTRKIIPVLKKPSMRKRTFHLITGPAYSHERLKIIRLLTRGLDHVRLYSSPGSLAMLYSKTQLGIISGGVMLYEHAFLGHPVICIPQNNHQEKNIRRMRRRGFSLTCKTFTEIESLIQCLAGDDSMQCIQAGAGINLVDGRGLLRITETVYFCLKEKGSG